MNGKKGGRGEGRKKQRGEEEEKRNENENQRVVKVEEKDVKPNGKEEEEWGTEQKNRKAQEKPIQTDVLISFLVNQVDLQLNDGQ